MNQRSRILAGLFGLAIAYGVVANVVYPRWIEPLVKIEDRVAARQADLEKLQALEGNVEAARRAYLSFLERSGSTDVGKVETAARERLNKLINKHGLEQASVSPNRGTVDRKTGWTRLTLTVAAEGTSQAAMQFLKDVSEMPQLMRVTSATLYPAAQAKKADGKGAATERIALRAPIEVLVLPQDRMLGKRVSDDELNTPEQMVRHQDRNYALIWERTPFSEYVPLDPLVVNAGAPINIEVGKPAAIQASAQGGDGNYTYTWSPAEGLSEPNTARTKVDTSAEGNFLYTVTVTDGKNNRASATARVTVVSPPPPPPAQVAVTQPANVPPPTPPPPPKPVRARSPNAQDLRLGMILTRVEDGQSSGGVMVYDPRTRQSQFHALGAPFEGGTLVYVHPRAALVEWQDHFFAYPVGEALNQDVDLDQTENFPYLKKVIAHHREAKLTAAPEPAAVEVAADAPPVDGTSPEAQVLPVAETGAASGAPPPEGPVAPQGAEPVQGQGDSVPAPAGGEVPGLGMPPGKDSAPLEEEAPAREPSPTAPSAVQPTPAEAAPAQTPYKLPPPRRVAPRRRGTTVGLPTPAQPAPAESGSSAGTGLPSSAEPAAALPAEQIAPANQAVPEPPQKPDGATGVQGSGLEAIPASVPADPAVGPPADESNLPADAAAAENAPPSGELPAGSTTEELSPGKIPEKDLNSKEENERRRKILENLRKQREEKRQRSTK